MDCELKETTIEESSLMSMPNSTNEKIDSLTDSRSDSPLTQAKSSTVSVADIYRKILNIPIRQEMGKMFSDESDIETYSVYGSKQPRARSRTPPPKSQPRLHRTGVPRFGEADYRPNADYRPKRATKKPAFTRNNYRRSDGFQSDYDYSGKRNRNGHKYITNYSRSNDRQVFIKRYQMIFDF